MGEAIPSGPVLSLPPVSPTFSAGRESTVSTRIVPKASGILGSPSRDHARRPSSLAMTPFLHTVPVGIDPKIPALVAPLLAVTLFPTGATQEISVTGRGEGAGWREAEGSRVSARQVMKRASRFSPAAIKNAAPGW